MNIKTKFSVNDVVFLNVDGKPFEDKVSHVGTLTDEHGTDVTYKLIESGDVEEKSMFASKRDFAVSMGWVEKIVRKRKDESIIIEDADKISETAMNKTEEENVIIKSKTK